MPEGPEVKAYADKLNSLLVEYPKLNSVEILSGRYTKNKPEGLEKFNLNLKLGSVGVKGKFLYFEFLETTLNNNLYAKEYIWSTLGLTGKWLDFCGDHARIRLDFDRQSIWFCDQRNFGTIHFAKTLKQTYEKLESLGIDLLNEEHSIEDTYGIFNAKRNQEKTIAEILMNQANYAGVGNYIKAEALYRARISPWRLGKNVTKGEQENLHIALSYIMNSAYEQKFQKTIYKRTYAPCGNEIISQATSDGRTTWWVPKVQR